MKKGGIGCRPASLFLRWDKGLDVEVQRCATSLYSVQHRKQKVDNQHIDQRASKSKRHSQRVAYPMRTIVKEFGPQERRALVIPNPAEASVRTDPTL